MPLPTKKDLISNVDCPGNLYIRSLASSLIPASSKIFSRNSSFFVRFPSGFIILPLVVFIDFRSLAKSLIDCPFNAFRFSFFLLRKPSSSFPFFASMICPFSLNFIQVSCRPSSSLRRALIFFSFFLENIPLTTLSS